MSTTLRGSAVSLYCLTCAVSFVAIDPLGGHAQRQFDKAAAIGGVDRLAASPLR